uniref:hypothetical protein n=1 Tax=Amycolatopsis sp. CA-096443 TaxID=3239919 RepID=UPI003F49110F
MHELENGNGPCGGNVFDLDDAIGDHGCIAEAEDVTDNVTGAAVLPAIQETVIERSGKARVSAAGLMDRHETRRDDKTIVS